MCLAYSQLKDLSSLYVIISNNLDLFFQYFFCLGFFVYCYLLNNKRF